jgi:GntR family transcriptional regulator, transcriptional repressor for pyruvate dehydrogenase complex
MRKRSIWEPVALRGAIYSRIVTQIERLIDDQRLKPGDRLPAERDLAHLLGVSRASLREAMKTLEAVGRIKVKHGSGVWIQRPDPLRRLSANRDVGLSDLFAMRKVLEIPAAGWAAKSARLEDVQLLQDLLDSLALAQETAEMQRLDIKFHLRIAELAGNRFLLQTMGILHQMLREGMETTLTIPGRHRLSMAEHQKIVDALRRRDVARARGATRAHIVAAEAAALNRIAGEKRA